MPGQNVEFSFCFLNQSKTEAKLLSIGSSQFPAFDAPNTRWALIGSCKQIRLWLANDHYLPVPFFSTVYKQFLLWQQQLIQQERTSNISFSQDF